MIPKDFKTPNFLTGLLLSYSQGKQITIGEALDFVIRDWVNEINIGELILLAYDLEHEF